MILEHYREDYYTGRGRQFSDYGALWIRKILGIMIPLKERSDAFDEISVRNPRPDSDGIVSVSLWGDGVSDRFRKGLMDPLLSNVGQLRSKLPGWVCRVYASSELPEQVLVELVGAGCEVYIMPAPRQGGEGFAWRFLATNEQKPAIIHDADMTFDELRPGLFDVVEQWLKTDKPFLRRQLYAVNVWGNPVSGGCWGSRPRPDGKNPLVDMKDRLSKYSFEGYGIDEVFLTKEIWPIMKREGYYTTEPSSDAVASCVILVLSVISLVLVFMWGVLFLRRRENMKSSHLRTKR